MAMTLSIYQIVWLFNCLYQIVWFCQLIHKYLKYFVLYTEYYDFFCSCDSRINATHGLRKSDTDTFFCLLDSQSLVLF